MAIYKSPWTKAEHVGQGPESAHSGSQLNLDLTDME